MDDILNRINDYGNIVVEWQKKLVSIPALAPEYGGDGEHDKAEYIKSLLTEIGFDEIKQLDAPDDRVPTGTRPNILAKMYGKQPAPTVWVMSHIDVVPAGDESLWQSPPFQLRVDGDKLFGRGVEDNHQGLLCGLLACKALRELGIQPVHTIGLAIVADEENGSRYGLQYVMNHHKKEFSKEDLIIVPDAGDPAGTAIEVAEKSILWLKFRVTGKSCHASTPAHGVNAHRAAAHLIVRLESLYQQFANRDDKYDEPRSTFEPTRVETIPFSINTISGEHIFYLDCRILPNIPVDDVFAEIETIVKHIEKSFKVNIKVSSVQQEQAAPATPEESAVVHALQKAIKRIKRKDASIIGIGGGTVASVFRKAGFPAAVWGTILDTCHQPNETALISNILQDAQVLAYMFMQEG